MLAPEQVALRLGSGEMKVVYAREEDDGKVYVTLAPREDRLADLGFDHECIPGN
jgi:hypothetical protein